MGNRFFDAGTGGFTAGQGTGFDFMTAPWLQYEAYGITFTHNVIHDTQGAGIGVNGGTDILMADNTMYRVGSRSHVIEVVFGSRSCDGDAARCLTYLAQGGWGPNVPGRDEPIPNRNVVIRDNIVLNPDGFESRWQHFAVATPRMPSAGSTGPGRRRTAGLRQRDLERAHGPFAGHRAAGARHRRGGAERHQHRAAGARRSCAGRLPCSERRRADR